MDAEIISIEVQEFVRRFKKQLIEHNDAKFCFFLGAGCSVSSGIPTARTLVDNVWLPKLKEMQTGNQDNFSDWLKEKFPEYNKDNAAQYYGDVIEKLFLTPKERQQEIERLVTNKDPGFGYAVLAQLLTEKCGKHCNIVLTTNFDDMVADAIYLYTNKKPVVIPHESLVGFLKISDTRPLVVKLHGDSRLSPRNTWKETAELNENVKKVIINLFSEAGLIFIGYGGNDKSITDILAEVPEGEGSFPWGIYWVGREIPSNKMAEFLKHRNAIWVNHRDFDELMLLIKEELKKEFELKPPSSERFENLFKAYFETFQKLSFKVHSKSYSGEREVLEMAVEKASKEFKSWWAVELEASKFKNTNVEKAEQIYQEGINQFPDSHELICNYAIFLTDIRKKHEKAEEMYRKALEIEPEDATYLGNYANFLKNIRKNYKKAEKLYRRALEIEPDNAHNLGNYANFLCYILKDYNKAEEFYRKSLEIEPENAIYLGNYALFIKDIRKDYNRAGELYIKALEIDPENVNNLENYANFLRDVLKDYNKAEELYRKALEIEPENINNLGDYANFLRIIRKDYDKAEEFYKKILEIEPNHAGNLGNYALFLYEIKKDFNKAEEFYRKALEVDPEHTNNLGNYANFLADVRKDYEQAEEFYKKALKIDPEHTNNLNNYAAFLKEICRN